MGLVLHHQPLIQDILQGKTSDHWRHSHAVTNSVASQLNSISLSKNILRSLQATATDMPPLESFPKSHQVTFKYYAGVIFFLEEDYSRVGHAFRCAPMRKKSSRTNATSRQKNISHRHTNFATRTLTRTDSMSHRITRCSTEITDNALRVGSF